MMAAPHMAPSERPTSSGYVDSATHAVRCHWDDTADRDRCAIVLASAEDAWAAQVDRAGFLAPVEDDDGLLDIYLTDEGTFGGAYTDGPYEDADRSDDKMGCWSYVAIDRVIPDDQLPAYVAHEFNHVLQFAMDFTEPTYPIWEGTASAAEQWTYPDDGVVPSVVADFQAEPWLGFLGDSYSVDYWSEYEYGTAVWILHLDTLWGDGQGSGGAALWDLAGQDGWDNEPDVVDAYDALTGDWIAAWIDVSMRRTLLGTDQAPEWASYTSGKHAVALAADLDVADLPATATPEEGPIPTGLVYVRVTGATAGGTVTVDLADGERVSWALFAAEDGQGTSAVDVRTFTHEVTTGGEVYLGAINLGGESFDADDNLKQTNVTMTVSYAPPSAGDTGETDGPKRPPEAGEEAAGGCGCASGGAAGLVPAVLALLAVGRRRRTPW